MKQVLSAKKDFARICIEEANKVLDIEANSILNLKNAIREEFAELVELIIESRGRVIVSGVGKSGLVGKKIAATLSSTGTPSFFVHAGEALHGDLGMITGEDILIAISNSGETEEVLALIPSLRRIGAKLVAFTGNRESSSGPLCRFGHNCCSRGRSQSLWACSHSQYHCHHGPG